MVILSKAARRSRPKTGGVRPSIREVALLAADIVGRPALPGDPIAWGGRSYLVRAVDSGDYLHVGIGEIPSRRG